MVAISKEVREALVDLGLLEEFQEAGCDEAWLVGKLALMQHTIAALMKHAIARLEKD
jgi:hypothetical protein